MDLQIFTQKFLEPLTVSGSFLFHGKHSPLAAIAVADKREALTAIAAADSDGWKKQYAAYCKKNDVLPACSRSTSQNLAVPVS